MLLVEVGKWAVHFLKQRPPVPGWLRYFKAVVKGNHAKAEEQETT